MNRFGSFAAAVLAGACLLFGARSADGQVVAEPAMLTAGIPAGETFLPYIAIPDNSFVLGGMIRFAVADDIDIGGRAGLWLIDDAKDTPFAGADLRYGLLGRRLSSGGGLFHLSFDVGLGVSEPSATVWKFPVGFLAGIGFRLAGGDSEIFTFPRLELGVSSGDDSSDVALMLDLGGLFTITPRFGVMLDLRFGDGNFGEGDAVVVGLGGVWRL
ncbi:MAG: hypothetical protein GWN99_11820 [Gemmatimonadetes bacterium]|uniref:Outer membrane protein beta-barrel domain-containing protein n=1 Tax=Candidatus Kutchimonas denitrificans TaxID=3056748 RepID=A0AAE5CDA9_9BACT|nr:hypothetical protein [Gemmatimonadota bacterium]NIR75419.1 hypothetical protein [Candidatus Kutchimonas denitrificans]NIS01733.1 hypothetical protein [Gemmatimonadota bacterium]NIT67515.1 hypothetical protein [Gemmatimonadota bacterium]NIU53378.1 hypothetical protein [Gemmatimonadota bacterium]